MTDIEFFKAIIDLNVDQIEKYLLSSNLIRIDKEDEKKIIFKDLEGNYSVCFDAIKNESLVGYNIILNKSSIDKIIFRGDHKNSIIINESNINNMRFYDGFIESIKIKNRNPNNSPNQGTYYLDLQRATINDLYFISNELTGDPSDEIHISGNNYLDSIINHLNIEKQRLGELLIENCSIRLTMLMMAEINRINFNSLRIKILTVFHVENINTFELNNCTCISNANQFLNILVIIVNWFIAIKNKKIDKEDDKIKYRIDSDNKITLSTTKVNEYLTLKYSDLSDFYFSLFDTDIRKSRVICSELPTKIKIRNNNKSHKVSKETILQLKHLAEEYKDSFALKKMKSLEQKVNQKRISFFSEPLNKTVLVLSMLTNYYGQNWVLPIILYFGSGYGFYKWIMDINHLRPYSNIYFQFLNPTHSLKIFYENVSDLQAGTGAIDFFAKIVFFYLSVQTVTAFRKFINL